jgi:putative spermidine/putrescine transport system permease protein
MTPMAPARARGDAEQGSAPAVAALLLFPIAAVNGIGFLLPIINLLKLSFYQSSETGALVETFTFNTWLRVATDTFYIQMLVRTTLISLLITLLTLLVSYPIAFFIYRSTGALRSMLVVMVISPLLTSAVVRTYGWVAILSEQGLVNNLLSFIGAGPYRLIFNVTGIVIGLTEILMPYMILSLMAGFGRLDRRYEEASLSLGASPLRTFLTVTLPLTLPGIALGCLLCFVIAVSAFITPQLLGGGRVFLLATEIFHQAIVTLNWPVAAVLSMIVLIVFGAALTLYARALQALE